MTFAVLGLICRRRRCRIQILSFLWMDQPSEIRKQAATAWDVILLILSSVCLILIVLAVLVFCVYKKRQGLRIKAPSQDSMQLVYAEVTHSARNRTDTRPSTYPVQNEGVEYGTVVTSNQKKKGDDVQYRELVFNTPAQKKSKLPKVQEDCVYSGVQRS